MNSLLYRALAFGLTLTPLATIAGIPVIDSTNLTQNTVTALEQVAAYAQQVQQYEVQLTQYANMMQNTASLPEQTWSQVQQTINGLMNSMQGLNALTNGTGSVQSYLDKFQATSGYATQPCFNGAVCSNQRIQKLQADDAQANAAVKAATDSALRALLLQQTSLGTDASNVQKLQLSANEANGQKAALDAANELASAQANQLVQIRALLVAQQTMEATAMEQQNAFEAQHQAAHNVFFNFEGAAQNPDKAAGPTVSGH